MSTEQEYRTKSREQVDVDWLPERMKEYGFMDAYAEYERSGEADTIVQNALVDVAYARTHARNFLTFVESLNIHPVRTVMDAGCGIGVVCAGIKAILGDDAVVHGVDLSEAAIRVAAKRFVDCHFAAHSVDDPSKFDNDTFDLIHMREFYPFSRSSSLELHMHYLRALVRVLRPRGVLVSHNIHDIHGIFDTFDRLRRECLDIGYDQVLRRIAVPYRIYSRVGDFCYWPAVNQVMRTGLAGLEVLRPRTVTYRYVFRKAAS